MSIASFSKACVIPLATLATTYALSSHGLKFAGRNHQGLQLLKGRAVFTAFAAFGINTAAQIVLKGRFGLPAMSNRVKGLTLVAQLILLIANQPGSPSSRTRSRGDRQVFNQGGGHSSSMHRGQGGRPPAASFAQAPGAPDTSGRDQ